jgi:hypothetical protein
MTRIVLTSSGALFLASLGAFFLFIPPLWIATAWIATVLTATLLTAAASLLLTDPALMFRFGLQIELQPLLPASRIDPKR